MEPLFEVACLDTCIIYGEGKKRARKLKELKKPQKKQNEVKDGGILNRIRVKTRIRFTSVITPYEFIKELSSGEGISIKQSREIYEQIKSDFQILEIIPRPSEVNLSPALMNKICECGLELADGLQLYITSLRKMPFITSENDKLENMREFYGNVVHIKEILKHE